MPMRGAVVAIISYINEQEARHAEQQEKPTNCGTKAADVLATDRQTER